MQVRPDTVATRWRLLPVITLHLVISFAIWSGLPADRSAQLFLLPVLLAAAWFSVRGAIFSSLAAVVLLILCGYAWRSVPLPSLFDISLQGLFFVVCALLVANLRWDAARRATIVNRLRDRNAELLNVINRLTDTESELVEENARWAAVRERTMQFAGGMAHNLRTPITAIKGNAQMLLRHGKRYNEEKRSEMIQCIIFAANQLLNSIDNLLDASRIEAGRFSLEKQEVNIGKLVTDCVRMLSGAADEHVIELEVSDGLPEVQADPDNLTQVLTNLITNAMKYSAPQSKITVKAEREADRVAIRVQDEGIGIAEEDMGRIFERYYRSDEALARHIGGAGLGLSISKDIAREHGGDLIAQSKLGEGSIFTITLPLPRGQAAGEADANETDGFSRMDNNVA